MAHHGEEHRGHERDLEQLAPELHAVERIAEDRGAGGDDDRAENDAGDGGRPHPEAVEERQAFIEELLRIGVRGLDLAMV